jgi:hypothetical protein
MNKKLISLVTLLAIVILYSLSWAFNNVLVVDRTPFAYEKLTVTTGAVKRLNSTYREAAGAIFLTVETNSVRYKIDGGNPSSTDGHLISSGAFQNLYLHDIFAIKNLRLIALDGNSTAHVTYYRTNR